MKANSNYVKRLCQILFFVAIVANLYIFLTTFWLKSKNQSHAIVKTFGEVLPSSGDKIDWHDYKFMEYESKRDGPGEQGRPVKLTSSYDIANDKETFPYEGFSSVISDMISPNRSVPDVRHVKCKSIKYFKDLPSTSVIVIFYDEHWNLIRRCLHSIWNRTPKTLLHEIILVNDKSSNSELHYALKSYIADNFGPKVKLFMNDKRKGLIQTRMEGARKATGDVIVFLDSHMEVNVNWLPPLLEPIKLNPKTASVPILDSFSPTTLGYEFLGHGTRGGFDWRLVFKWMPMRQQDFKSAPEPFEYPVMTGGGYAIRRDYFFELGGYDEGMKVYNGENYEMSFKIWLCGGQMLQVPCSHVAHSSRQRARYKSENYGFDYNGRNLKRVAEVWMDEFKEEFYLTDPKHYEKIDPGDLTAALAFKKKMNCKPFKYFLDVVAPEICDRYNPSFYGNFASGAIISLANQKLCVSYMEKDYKNPLELTICSPDKLKPYNNQYFVHTWNRFIKYNDFSWMCIDSMKMNLYSCHHGFGNQLWKYDLDTHQIQVPGQDKCMTGDVVTKEISATKCDPLDINQKFTWGFLNETAFKNWQTYGIKVPYKI